MNVQNGNTRAIIEVDNLTIRYGENLVLRDVHFRVKRGEVFIVLGGSGCGKSTLLKHMIGLCEPCTGSITVDGDQLLSSTEEVGSRILKKIGVMFQGGALFGSMTLAENVMLPILEYTGLNQDDAMDVAKIKLGLVRLSGFENHYPAEISGGMRKRAAIARALALNPKILFLDEPSAGLDPITSAEIDSLMLLLNKNIGTTLVIVTHELQSIFTIADRVIFLDKRSKSIIAEGSPEELKNRCAHPFVNDFFNRRVHRT